MPELYSFEVELNNGKILSFYNVEGPIERIYEEFWYGRDDVAALRFV
jgi:hypothetical protein